MGEKMEKMPAEVWKKCSNSFRLTIFDSSNCCCPKLLGDKESPTGVDVERSSGNNDGEGKAELGYGGTIEIDVEKREPWLVLEKEKSMTSLHSNNKDIHGED